ncbi:MAG: FAD-dependent oxidoreductase [Pigmentiphaga sp.]|uniref:hydroxysqualene dehydroxylase n=1 Tax=Pigmentiphaga sp. TaxID=1977564 RepID=UPI0029B7F87A|nr:FAD-dependent oxidoreductase [Pigmentiphaga sp.]MDX3906358.1 FAD-dependent oxidoreductase [Pigmentiphaga sp.]
MQLRSSAPHPDVVIVGAGIAGLSCATLLAEAGLRVLVLEAGETPGGRARSWVDPATSHTVDIGPHVILNKYVNMLTLLSRLGTRSQIAWQTEELLTVLDKGRHIHFKMRGLPAPLHTLRNLHRVLPSVPLPQLLSNVPLAWRTMRSTPEDIRALDDRSGRDHLRAAGVSDDFIDWFWASAAIAFLNLPVEACSAASLMRMFVHLLGHNDAAFGFPKTGLSELYAWPAIQYIEKRGGEVRLSCATTGLRWEQGRVAGVQLDEGTRIDAPVVLAVPPDALPALLPPGHRLARLAPRFEPSPYISCYLWFDRKITTSRFWARPWSPQDFNTDFYDLSNVRTDSTGAGSLIASNIIWSHRVNGLPDAAVIEATLKEIGEFTPQARTARLLGASVHRIPMSVPCARPGIESARPATRQDPGLFLAGDWIDTDLPFCMESATRAGALAAEAVMADRGHRRAWALPPPAPRGLAGLLRPRMRGSIAD